MHLQVLHATAILAAPVVALQYLTVQFAVTVGIESEWDSLAESLPHDALPLSSDKNASCCGAGRNL